MSAIVIYNMYLVFITSWGRDLWNFPSDESYTGVLLCQGGELGPCFRMEASCQGNQPVIGGSA